MPTDRDTALLDEVYAREYYNVRLPRGHERPPPSYAVAVRSRPISASATSETSSSSRHHHRHKHVIKHKVTVTSRLPSASASASVASTSRKRSSQNPEGAESGPNSKKASETGATENSTESRAESPQPGPSGLQQNRNNGLDAPDLQLDCLSSDSDDDIAEEDVTVVKISRRRTKSSRKWHNSTTTINAPPGSIVEVDLTQESDHPDEEENDEIRVDSIRPRNGERNEGLIKLRQFATVPHLPPNVQSRGSTPSTTPAPSNGGNSSDSMQYWSNTDSYLEPGPHHCIGECTLYHSHHQPPPDYRPRRLRQPYHHQVGCQDAHCRRNLTHHPRSSASTSSQAVHYSNQDQPLDCRSNGAETVQASGSVSGASTSGASASTATENSEPPTNQRLINAVYRMQYHPSMRPRMHPRHQRLWHNCQYNGELHRRHMGSTLGAGAGAPPPATNPTPAHHPPPDYANMYPTHIAPMPAHLGKFT